MSKTVNIAVLNDYGAFSDRDEEYTQICERYVKFLSPLKIKTTHLDCFNPPDSTHLVLFDYGGMLPGCGGLIESNVRAVLRWAEDNPNKLVLVTSICTWGWYVTQIAEEMGLRDSDGSWKIHNIDVDNGLDGNCCIPDWFVDQFK